MRSTEGIKDVYTRLRTLHTPVIHSKNETHKKKLTCTHHVHRQSTGKSGYDDKTFCSMVLQQQRQQQQQHTEHIAIDDK